MDRFIEEYWAMMNYKAKGWPLTNNVKELKRIEEERRARAILQHSSPRPNKPSYRTPEFEESLKQIIQVIGRGVNTSVEIEAVLKMSKNTVCPRLRELVDRGMLTKHRPKGSRCQEYKLITEGEPK